MEPRLRSGEEDLGNMRTTNPTRHPSRCLKRDVGPEASGRDMRSLTSRSSSRESHEHCDLTPSSVALMATATQAPVPELV